MIKRKVRVTWLASDGDWKEEFSTKKEAELNLIKRQAKVELERLRLIFRKYFKVEEFYSHYRHKCVDCDKLLDTWEMKISCYDSERGRHYKHNDSYMLFNGCRCEKCHEKIEDLFEEMQNFNFEINGVKVFIEGRACINLLQSSNKLKLEIYKIVENWDDKK